MDDLDLATADPPPVTPDERPVPPGPNKPVWQQPAAPGTSPASALPAAPPAPPSRLAPPLPLLEWLALAWPLPLVELAIDLTVPCDLRLPSPACTLVRGLLGQRLRELRCSTGAPHCGGCPAAITCDYAQVFDGPAPHPFWLRGIPATTLLRARSRLAVRLYLAEPAYPVLPYLDVALRDALAKLAAGCRVPPPQVRYATLAELTDRRPARRLRVWTDTPAILRGDEELAAALCPQAPWMAMLARAGVRRLDSLVGAFGPKPGEPLPRAELPRLARLSFSGSIEPWSSSRYSHRQRQRMPLDGVHVDAVLAGRAVAELAPLFRALAVTGVGKATSLGLGALGVSPA